MKVLEILLDGNRAKLVVETPNPDRYLTNQRPHVPKLLFKLFPHLSKHRCENDAGLTFRKECDSTEMPHLLEHLIAELQLQVDVGGRFKGETSWDWHVDPAGLFHVEVDYENEMLVLGAIRLAERIIAALDDRHLEAVNVEEEIEKLKELAILGERIKNGDSNEEELQETGT